MSNEQKKPRWTDAQLDAIAHRDGHVLVSAAAGAGKTGVLTERVVRKVASGECSITELLVVTFTDAAAAEMRRRIADKLRDGLSEARRQDQSRQAERLERQIVLLDVGQVCTLHSFCAQLLRENFHRLGLDPAFEIIEPNQAELIKQEVLDELLEEYYNAADSGPDGRRQQLEGLLAWRQAGGDDWLRHTVLRLDEKIGSLARPDEWWRQVEQSLCGRRADRLAGSPWAEPLRRLFELEFDAASARLDQARAMARQFGLDVYVGPIESVAKHLAALRECLASPAFVEPLHAELDNWPITRLPAVRGDPPGKGPVSGLIRSTRKSLAGLRALTARGEPQMLADLAELAPQVRTLAELCRRFRQGYDSAKRDRSAMDFADLERGALQLLDGFAEVCAALRNRYREVLVDEYQDISPVQDAILRLIGGRLFMVGDLKQSIYRFRLAQPDIFAATFDAFGAGRGGRLISLPDNFRSRRVIIDAVNRVFEQLMRPTRTLLGKAADPEYDEKARLRFAAPAYRGDAVPPDSPVELHLLEINKGNATGDAADGPGQSDPADSSAAEEPAEPGEAESPPGGPAERDRLGVQSRLVGQRIRQLLGLDGQAAATVWDDRAKVFRPARPRDIVVLLRTAARVANQFAEELTRMGLAVHAQQPGGYFEATEVSDVRSLLAVLDNPRQDIPLAAVLRSPLMHFAGGPLSADELAAVRLARPEGPFHEAVLECAMRNADCGLPNSESRIPNSEFGDPKLARLVGQIDQWRTMARRRPLSELVADIYRVTGCLDYVSGLRGGPQRRANLLDLAGRARQFDGFARQGLARFARFLDELEASGEELGIPSALSEADDVVRVVTIHGAKGLEFPIVILADLEHQFNRADCRLEVLFHRELMLGLRCLDAPRRIHYPSLAYQLIGRQLEIELAMEEMRLLYVAMTRARDRLILFASQRSLKDKVEYDWQGPITSAAILSANRMLDWLAPAVLCGSVGQRLREALRDRNDLPSDPVQAADDVFSVRLYGAAWLTRMAEEVEQASRPTAVGPVAADQAVELPPGQAAIYEDLTGRLSFRYPLAALAGEPAKRSVSELKALFDARAEADESVPPQPVRADHPAATGPSGTDRLQLDPDNPPWDQPPAADARARGLATHAAIQRLDLAGPLDRAEHVADQIAAMQAAGLLRPDEDKLIDAAAIAAFFDTELGRLLRADPKRVRREWPFSLAVPVGELHCGTRNSECGIRDAESGIRQFAIRNPQSGRDVGGDRVLVQGVIDVLFEQADGSLVVLDFKTDSVRSEAQARQRAETYRHQLGWYARAAEAILGRPVARRLVYFLRPRCLVELPAD